MELTFTGVTGKTPFTIELHTGKDEMISVAFDPARAILTVDRTRSGQTAFHKTFSARHEAPIRLADDRLAVRLLLDTASLELFAQAGEVSLTDLIFPSAGSRHLTLASNGAGPAVAGIIIQALQPAR